LDISRLDENIASEKKKRKKEAPRPKKRKIWTFGGTEQEALLLIIAVFLFSGLPAVL
jgi:hypothetical protein